MKKIKTIVVASLLAISMVGCGNSTADKAIEQGKLAMASKEYDKALGSFQLAIDEGSKDEEVLKILQIIEKYNEAKNSFDEEKIEEAKKIADEISEDYKNYAIKDDIDKLKKEIDDTYKVSQEIKSEIEKLNTLFEEKKYDEAKDAISSLEEKELTENQTKEVNDIKNKVNEEIAKKEEKEEKEERKVWAEGQLVPESEVYYPELMESPDDEYSQEQIEEDYENGYNWLHGGGVKADE
ncbi:TPA: hypothetical protein KOT44_002062 [Clostridioides difficile]|nr:hypothetical protein [Clostridioides difficile]